MTRYTPLPPWQHEPITGPHDVSLRPIAESDVPNIVRWRNEPGVVEWWDEAGITAEEVLEEDFALDVNPCWRFIIVWDGRDIGGIQYHHPYADTDYDWSAGIDIYIGEPDARDRGVGTEAVRTLLAYLFEVKQVHRVTIDPDIENKRGIRAYEKAGFVLDGVMRHNERYEDGRWGDTQYLSILEDEWPAARERWMAERAG